MPRSSNQRRSRHVAFVQSLVRWFFRILLTVCYRVRVHGLEHYPEDDRMLVCANHQSFLDPIVLGVVCPRPVNYLARKTLFSFKPLAVFLRFNDSIPIDRDATGLDGVKETLKRLKRGEAVVMFPEGTRSDDGLLQPFKPGFCLLARRSKATLMPIALDGCYQAYSRKHLFPRLGTIHAVMGEPISYQQYADLSDEETAFLLESRIRSCFDEARRRWELDQKGPN